MRSHSPGRQKKEFCVVKEEYEEKAGFTKIGIRVAGVKNVDREKRAAVMKGREDDAATRTSVWIVAYAA